MKEILIENKEITLRIYLIVVFVTPWLISMLWQFKYMSGLREKMGPEFWFTFFPSKKTATLVKESKELVELQKQRNIWFVFTLGIWLAGAVIFVLLLAWLNSKY